MNDTEVKPVKQCKSCPWRIDCDPEADIPNYVPELAKKLTRTIATGLESLRCVLGNGTMNVMACHYSKPGEEIPCAGWLYNQLGSGNNIAVRLRVIQGKLPPPEIDGEQHENYEDTLPCHPKTKRATPKRRSKPRAKRSR